jgi:hypothetical protein
MLNEPSSLSLLNKNTHKTSSTPINDDSYPLASSSNRDGNNTAKNLQSLNKSKLAQPKYYYPYQQL